jgi:hypothetical protein
MLDPELTVSQVLAAYPQAWRVFTDLKTDCVGCYLMAFCSLREVADQYQINLDKVLAAFTSANSQ